MKKLTGFITAIFLITVTHAQNPGDTIPVPSMNGNNPPAAVMPDTFPGKWNQDSSRLNQANQWNRDSAGSAVNNDPAMGNMNNDQNASPDQMHQMRDSSMSEMTGDKKHHKMGKMKHDSTGYVGGMSDDKWKHDNMGKHDSAGMNGRKWKHDRMGKMKHDSTGNMNGITGVKGDQTMDKMTNSSGSGKMKKTGDRVTMKDGKMIVIKNGRESQLLKNMTLENGSIVMTDGTVKMPDGSSMKLKNGEHIDMRASSGKKTNKKG